MINVAFKILLRSILNDKTNNIIDTMAMIGGQIIIAAKVISVTNGSGSPSSSECQRSCIVLPEMTVRHAPTTFTVTIMSKIVLCFSFSIIDNTICFIIIKHSKLFRIQ